MSRKRLTILFLFLIGFWAYAQDLSPKIYFPIKSAEPVKGKKVVKAYNKLEQQYLNHELDTKNLPFFMTNYAHDTIWGYAKIKGPKLIQKKGVSITVNEMGELNHYVIKPEDVDAFTIYYGRDSVKFRTIFFPTEIYKKINKGTIDKSYYGKEVALHKRTEEASPALLLVLEEGHFLLLQYLIDENEANSTYFIIYRNQLFIYSYEYFLEKGIISSDISEKEFYSIHPKFWVRLFNKRLSEFYNSQKKQ